MVWTIPEFDEIYLNGLAVAENVLKRTLKRRLSAREGKDREFWNRPQTKTTPGKPDVVITIRNGRPSYAGRSLHQADWMELRFILNPAYLGSSSMSNLSSPTAGRMLESFCMKYAILLVVLAAVGVGGYAWWSASSRIDSRGKIHTDLYEDAGGTWDPQMEIFPFERLPSTMLTVRWQPPTKTYNHFLITISTVDGTLLRTESGEHDRVSLDIDGLTPETEYVFALQACLDPRCTEWLIAQKEYRGTTTAAVDISQEEI